MKYPVLGSVVIIIWVAVVFWPALSSKVLLFDDDEYLINNQLVQNPGLKSAWRFFSKVLEPSTVRGYYQPFSMLSLMCDYALGGRPANLAVFRITSLLLHIINSLLVVIFLYMLFDNFPAAFAIGLLFAVHPLAVESIPWLAERKTLLAMFFAMLFLIVYIRYARKGGRRF